MVKPYQAIKSLYRIFDSLPGYNVLVFNVNRGKFFSFTYHKDTKEIFVQYLCSIIKINMTIEEFLVDLNCQIHRYVDFYDLRIHITVDIIDGDFEKFYYAGMTILRYYKKYRYNLYRKRRDPLKEELMKYCYHPSRVEFNVEDFFSV